MAVELHTLRASEVLSALTYALDITEGQPPGHALRTCLIGMRLANELGLDPADRSALFYALLLKDVGCSSNAAKVCSLFQTDDLRLKRALKTSDWTRSSENVLLALRHAANGGSPVARAAALLRLGLDQRKADELFEVRCERGADIARMLEMPEATAEAIAALDEHWDGNGRPRRLVGDQIPLLARILCLSQTVDVFVEEHGVAAAYRIVRERAGRWFDPAVVCALGAFERDDAFWASLTCDEALEVRVAAAEPPDRAVRLDEAGVDRIAEAFARVVDAKSPFTALHSDAVAETAVGVGAQLGLPQPELRRLKRAGLVHDIGKLGISNLVLDKSGPLDQGERAEIERHPTFTRQILARVGVFAEIADDAAAHHEKLDGSGYPLGLAGDEITLSARILVVSDIFDALTSARPYRPALALESALAILEHDAGSKLDADCVAAVRDWAGVAIAA